MEYQIRFADLGDWKEAARVEAACFPASEAADGQTFMERIRTFPESFLTADAGGKMIGFINGCATDEPAIRDEMFADSSLHQKDGRYQAVFGLAVAPECRRQGVAAALMERLIGETVKRRKRGLILTCKEGLIPYYERFGYKNQGVSRSAHGGAVWYDMLLLL